MISMKLSGQEITALLPSLQELPGWQLNQEPLIYEGDRLFELIDGGADIYLEYGFSQVISAQYIDPAQNNILVEIYEMTDEDAAYGIFSITQQTVSWSKEFGNLSAISSDYISFWKGKYYVNLSWSSSHHSENPSLAQLVALISGKIKETGNLPSMITQFKFDADGIKTIYFKGNLGLSNFYYFDYKDIFSVNEGLARTIGNQHRIIFTYENAAKSAEGLSSAKQNISINKRFSDLAEAEQGFSCKDNKGNLILARQVEQFIVVLVGFNQETNLVPVMDEISQKIESISR